VKVYRGLVGFVCLVVRVSTACVSRWYSAHAVLTSFSTSALPPAYAGGTDSNHEIGEAD
jgi:hypothetical protein